jgi:2-oxoglutarate ferredoxin oxidoreductase subunit beta
MMAARVDYEQYLRSDRIPHILCAGCGHGTSLKAMIRAIAQLNWSKDELVMVSGIGCSGRVTGYVDCNTLHTTHGRALAFAAGIKLARPELKVVVVTGDGDGIAIGGNHLIHAARRNLDLKVVLLNNFIYGMTGGQVSPTTPLGCKATTAPYGSYEHPFNIAELVAAAGGNFVARSTVFHVVQLEKLLVQAFQKKGFSFVEVISPCPTAYGRRNKLKGPVAMLNDIKERTVPVHQAKTMSEEELAGKIVTGVLLDRNQGEYLDIYHKAVANLKGGTP